MSPILGIKKSAPWNKRKQTVSSDGSRTQQTPSKSSIGVLYLATLIPNIGLLSVRKFPFPELTRVRFPLRQGRRYRYRPNWQWCAPRWNSVAATPSKASRRSSELGHANRSPRYRGLRSFGAEATKRNRSRSG